MISFDPEHPFPLVDSNAYSYKDAQDHAVQVDQWLGFDLEPIEDLVLGSDQYSKNSADMQCWLGLPVQAMQTPYTEIRQILDLLPLTPGQTLVDMGCSYGRMAHVVGKHYPDIHFIGYELVRERVEEGQRILDLFKYPTARLEVCDLSAEEFKPVAADYYFIFDFGNRQALEKTLEDLRQIALQKHITVIARGRSIRHRIYQDHPWLWAMNEPQAFEHFTIFTS